MWIAVDCGNDKVLFNSETVDTLSWLKKPYGIGETREEAVKNLERRLAHVNE